MRAAQVGCLTLAFVIAGCAFDENDLHTWRQMKEGDRKLAGFLADPERDLTLRILAASYLLDLRDVPQVLGVVRDATADDRRRLLPPLSARVTLLLGSADTPVEVQAAAVNLGYHLLQYAGDLDEERADKLAVAVTTWAVDHLPPNQVLSALAQNQLVLAAGAARPQATAAALLARLEQTQSLAEIVFTARMAVQLKDAEGIRQAAVLLLGHARRLYPELPALLADTMVHNGNETLLRVLLDAAGDPRVPSDVRAAAVSDAADSLGEKAIPGLLRLLAIDDPAHGNETRWQALERLWEIGGVPFLRDALRALPPGGTWPTEGEQLKSEVDSYCDSRVSRQRAAALPALSDLLADPSWVARIFAAECIVRLFPDDAARLLAPLAKDETPLPGWSADGQPTTIGAVVRRVTD